MEGTTSTNGIKVKEIWREMPRQASGPQWASVIEDTIARYEEWRSYNPGATADQAREDGVPEQWADGWPSVYYGQMWDMFHALDLWAVDDVEEMVEELMPGGEFRPINETAALYCYAAAYLTMEAVLRVADFHDEGGYLCDRCRERFPYEEVHVTVLRGYGQLCGECYEIARAIESGDMS